MSLRYRSRRALPYRPRRFVWTFTVGPATYQKDGSLFASVLVSGADTFTASESGSLIADTDVSGADVFTSAETGALIARALTSGTRFRDRQKAGDLTPDTSLSGADVFTAAEAGALIALAQLVGGRTATFNRRGELNASALLAGVSLLGSALTMLDAIYTGRIGQGLTGGVPSTDDLTIGDTVAGLYVQPERPEGGFVGDTVAGLVQEDHTE